MFKVSDEIVPVPQKGAGKVIYPFARMEVGQHFDAPRDMGETKSGIDRRRAIIATCAAGYSKKYNPSAKFTVRMIDDNTVRCWRIA